MNGRGAVQLADRCVEYSVRTSRGAKRARIRVTPHGVEVSLPPSAPPERAGTFLEENAAWVLAQLAFVERLGSIRVAPRPSAPTLLFRGTPRAVRVTRELSTRRFGIVEEKRSGILVRVPASVGADPARTLELWLRRQARENLGDRLAVRSEEMRVVPGRVYVMAQRTRWGNCSARGNVSFNWRLVMAPPDVLDYVVVHELAHLLEATHCLRFWLIVRSHCQEFELHRRWLRENEHRLVLPDLSGPYGNA